LKTFCVWITGISGAGKTTLANSVNTILNSNNYSSVNLDGDSIRKKMNNDLGFSMKDRDENIRRIACMSELLSQQKLITIVSVISPMRYQRALAKKIYGENFNEIYLKTSVEKCIEMDVKGLYKKAINQKDVNFTALTAPYEEPKKPDLLIDTKFNNIEQSFQMLMEFLQKKYKIEIAKKNIKST
jgi:adenylyl-sulfate kinase